MLKQFARSWMGVGNIVFLIIIFSFLPIQLVRGDITGKIAGKIVDENNMPLPGVNVMIEGTLRGSATDQAGKYFILSVPPGAYSVSASMMGYNRLVQTKVLVQSGRTTILDFTLKESVLDLGQEVVVTAERPVIEVDRTSTEFILNSQEIDRTPLIQSVSGLVRYMPGVGLDGGNNLIIRGGDYADINMYFDGIPLDDYRDINIFSVEEASITTGGIGAEYGNAQGGVISVVTKDGSESYHGTVEYALSPPQLGHWGANYWDPAYHLDSEGNTRLRWDDAAWANEVDSLTGRKVHEKVNYDEIWGQSIKLALSGPLFIPALQNKVSFLKKFYFSYATQFSQGSAGPIAVTRYSLPYTRHNWKLTFKALPNLTFRSGGFYNWSKGYNSGGNVGSGVSFTTGGLGSQDIEGAIRGMRIGAGGQYTDDRNIFLPIDYSAGGTNTNEEYLVYLNMVHMINPSTYYDLKFYRQESTRENQNLPDTIITSARTDKDGWYYIEGGKGLSYTDANSIRTGVKLDFSSQIHPSHLVKIGVDYQRYDIWQTSYQHNGTTVRELSRICKDFKTGEGITPTKIAAYLSDKMEFGGLVVNFGGRYDYYDWGTKFPVTYSLSKLSRVYNSFTRFANLPEELWVNPKPLQAFSPRLGLSHPISERATVHFFYGSVYQLPEFWDIYHDEWVATNAKNEDDDINKNGVVDATEMYNRLNDKSNRSHYGNPTLDYEKTTSFEMGVDWNFYQDYILTTTTYYKSAQNQIKGGSTHQFWDPNRESPAPYVHIRNNTQYEDAKGFEFLLKKRFSKIFSFQLSFNLAWATDGWSGERVRTYIPDSSFIAKYYFEKYTDDSNGDGTIDELDSGAEVPKPMSDTDLNLMEKRKIAATEYLQELREQGADIKQVDGVDGLYYVSTHYSSVGHPRENIERRTSYGLILYLDLPSDFGPAIAGYKPFANIHANLSYQHHDGLPYQYASIDGLALWRSAPPSTNVNLRVEKGFKFGGINHTLFVSVSNLFNQRDLNNSGSFDDIVSLRDYVSYGLEGYSPLYDYAFDYRGKTDGGIYLGSPRSVSFGLRMSF
ncbi:TonB-dependent receptor [candidate division KSB1 bacterium]|nr:TonB-dependent receptor [candidate division KSB1 bacterium]